MQKWEYRTEEWTPGFTLQEFLNSVGREGWELAAVVDVAYIFKRRLPEEK